MASDMIISKTKVWTETDLGILDHLQTPIWVFDFQSNGKWWANRSGLRLWHASSLDEFRERGRNSPISESTRLRLEALRTQLERGETSCQRWNFYPTGHAPFLAELLFSRIDIADEEGSPSRLAMLVEARPVGEEHVDPFVRRGVEVLRHTSEMVSLYKQNGELLMRNAAAIVAWGDPTNIPPGTDALAQVFVSPVDLASVRKGLERGPVRGTFEVRVQNGLAWHVIDARTTTDPVTGESVILINHRDISERISAEQALEESREKLAFQTDQLRRLAASPLRIWKGILALPLIGRIDEMRIRAGLDGIEARAQSEQIKVVLIDLTGSEVVDAEAALAIRRLIRSLALQGIVSRVVGVRATLARTLVSQGIELGDVPVHASLADALARELG